jgi:hypothetical protein
MQAGDDPCMTLEEKASQIYGIQITDDFQQDRIEMMKVFPIGSAKVDVLNRLNNIVKSRDDCEVKILNRPDGASTVLFDIAAGKIIIKDNDYLCHSTMFFFSQENKLTGISPKIQFMLMSGHVSKNNIELSPEEKATKIFGIEITDSYKQNSVEMMKVFPVGSAKADVLKKLNNIKKFRDDCKIIMSPRPDETSTVTFNIASTAAFDDIYKIHSTLFIFSKEEKLMKISTATVTVPKSEYTPTNKE